MVISLADAQVNTQDDVDFAVIDDLRRRSWLLDQIPFDDCVNPSGGGSTLTYGYTRLVTPAPAAFREFNREYDPGQAVRKRYTVDLKPLGGSFNVDRALARLGQAATNEEAFQFEQLSISVRTRFQDELINGDTAVDTKGFDGLDKSLAGTITEIGADTVADWTSEALGDDRSASNDAIDLLDQLVHAINGGADAILTNDKGAARVRSLGRRAGYYTRSEDALGREVERFGTAVIVDLGDNTAGTGTIIPTETRTVGGESVTGLTDIYAVQFGLRALHGVSVLGPLLQTFRPDYTAPGAVKKGEMEMGPVAGVLKSTRGAGVLRNVKVLG
ncbi:phage major capsid protein [Cellulomonas hominis]|uniref:Phage major capsid protein n=1 Tax=Cellulomonas hominis TaxID=156981 RepID=A0A7Z8K3F5_9CELL|nr:phage major capsid protein [Cellulomonas hominis]TKR27139.1 phage major capsid protein [Cellulomonas hominis]